ncbi:MAG: hypothetical protein LBE76_00010 [Nitrososphaerota archaeon]|nr:hypothetical protein [Nitrososphaerota archaeon]
MVLKNTDVYVSCVDYLGGKLVVVYNPFIEVLGRRRLYDAGGGEVGVEFFWVFL